MIMNRLARLPSLTDAQQFLILTHLAYQTPYTKICELFLEKYSDFGADLPTEVVSTRLYDTVRKLKQSKSEEIAQIADSVIRSKIPEYRFKMLDQMLHETPDVEVIYTTPEGVQKKQCNRAVKVKIIELMERIDGTFDKAAYDTFSGEIPELVEYPFGPPPNYEEEMKRYHNNQRQQDEK